MTAEPVFAVDALAEFVVAADAADLPENAAMLLRPFNWERTVAKFDRLAQRNADPGLRAAIVDAVADLDHVSVPALTELLTAVGAALGPTVSRGRPHYLSIRKTLVIQTVRMRPLADLGPVGETVAAQ